MKNPQKYNVASIQKQKQMLDIVSDITVISNLQQHLIHHGATLNNCTFNINVYNSLPSSPQTKPSKRRRVLYFSDEEE